MVEDRRRFQRVGLDWPLSVQLAESKCGPVYDLSEEGIAVSGLASRGAGEVIPFAFDLPDQGGRIQGRARIVWKSESVYRTGLHFLELADPSRKQLTEWISARAFTMWLVAAAKEGLQPSSATAGTQLLFDPELPDSGNEKEVGLQFRPVPHLMTGAVEPQDVEPATTVKNFDQRGPSRFIGVGLVAVALSLIIGYLAYSSRVARNHAATGGGTPTAKMPEPASQPDLASPELNTKSQTGSAGPLTPRAAEPVTQAVPKTDSSPSAARLDTPGFVLQVGAMTLEGNADALAQDLQKKKFPAFVYRRGSDGLYRVVVGPFPDDKSSGKFKNELEKQGVKSFVKRWTPK